jgi:hypothetical protein
MRLDNATAHLMLHGTMPGIFEMADGAGLTPGWEPSEPCDLRIYITLV